MVVNDRTLEQRYRIYCRVGVQAAVCVAAVPCLEGVGPALAVLVDEGQIDRAATVGLLDACPGGVEPPSDSPVPGTWIVNPYNGVKRDGS